MLYSFGKEMDVNGVIERIAQSTVNLSNSLGIFSVCSYLLLFGCLIEYWNLNMKVNCLKSIEFGSWEVKMFNLNLELYRNIKELLIS